MNRNNNITTMEDTRTSLTYGVIPTTHRSCLAMQGNECMFDNSVTDMQWTTDLQRAPFKTNNFCQETDIFLDAMKASQMKHNSPNMERE